MSKISMAVNGCGGCTAHIRHGTRLLTFLMICACIERNNGVMATLMQGLFSYVVR